MAKRKGTKLSRGAARVGAEGVSRSRAARLRGLASRIEARGKAKVNVSATGTGTRQEVARQALGKMGQGKAAGVKVTTKTPAGMKMTETRARRLATIKLAAAAGTGG